MFWPLCRLIDINKAPFGASGFVSVGLPLYEHSSKDDRGLKRNDRPADGIKRAYELLIATYQTNVDCVLVASNAPTPIETRNVVRPLADRLGFA